MEPIEEGGKAGAASQIKAWALEEGFDRAGVATLEPLEHGAALIRWLERGDQAGMAYLERKVEERMHPAKLFEWARSALCVAVQYWPREPREAGEGETPQADDRSGDLWSGVARYARGKDYHDVLKKRLDALAARIRAAYPGAEARGYVDTGPVLERELAARAGLGAVGKNTLLLHPKGGSWFLLGELFLSLDLAPDEPISDLCARCTRCLTACPTGALREPYRLDSNLCISYWTIEHRGEMPEAVRPMLGEWVFGCDICQEVCPWNRKASERSDDAEFELPEGRRELDLTALLLLGREEYVERFRGSPMKRPKLEGLKRNAAVAMGNRGDAAYAPALQRALEDPEEGVRLHAEWALERLEVSDPGSGSGSIRALGVGPLPPGRG
jgi:epoxyqueuosine reductase